jgi:hypothetical protein
VVLGAALMASSNDNGSPQMNANERQFLDFHLRSLRFLRTDAFASILAKEPA